jgi:GH15 family glucan-1,4-alpha-glucosidase
MTEETENTELENETEVTYEEPESQDEGKVKQASNEDELDSYSKGVQSRIKKLTERYRQEERDKAEAVRLSQQLIEENNKLKTRVKALDTGYLSEYGSRLESQTESAKRVYKEAYEAGDTDKMLEAQQALSNIAVQQQQYNTAKARAEQQAKMPVQQAAPVQQQPQQQAAPVPDEKAVAWKDKNKWFGRDKIMTTAAYTIHQELVEEQGFDPNSDEYYSEVNRRMRGEFPHKFQSANKSGGGSQVASAGNSASRSTKSGRRSVKLSHSAVAIAKKLGVPLEEYAKYVKD